MNVLIIGGTRGLGSALVNLYSKSRSVITTTRSATIPTDVDPTIKFITNIDLTQETASATLIKAIGETKLDLVIYSAGYFAKDTLETLNWNEQLEMYKICAISPAFIAASLYKAKAFKEGAKFLNISTEGGSLTLMAEGGGNYGHHSSASSQNMVGRLLALDMTGVTVVNIHPGFMRTEMTKNVGYERYWDSGAAVTPGVAAQSLYDFEKTITAEKNGQFWAPRGSKDIGSWINVMGKNQNKDDTSPLQLPW